MSNRTAKRDKETAMQQGLFDNGPAEGSLDIVLGLKQSLSRLLRGHDRYLIAAQISRATLKEISKDSLDKVLSSDSAYQPSAVLVLAICKITGSWEPYTYQLEYLDCDVLGPGDRDLVALARKMEQRKILDQEIMQLQSKRGLR
jgi:hypothetical protein